MGHQPLMAIIAFALLSGQVSAQTPHSSDRRFISESKMGQWKASKLLGLRIYNDKNENIGQVTELLLNGTGKIDAVVISIGGFLGVGKHDVAVPFDEIKPPNREASTVSGGSGQAVKQDKQSTSSGVDNKSSTKEDVGTPAYGILQMSSEELKAAPEFKIVQ